MCVKMAKLKTPVSISSSDGLKKRKLFKKVSQKKNKNIKEKIKLAPQILQDEKSRIKKQQKLDIPIDLNEEIPKYNISILDVKNAIKGVIKFRTENPKLKNELFDESLPIYLQISCHRVPTGYPKILRIPLKHSLYSAESEICLVTSEVKGIRNIEHERHIEHYEKLLQDKGVENIKKIMTFHEFRTSYETFEQKNRLVDLYDVFLADSKISGKLVKKCGKIFYKKRKVPTAVKLQATKLKDHIEKVLCKAFLNLHLKGNSYTVQFGHTHMKEDHLVQNFKSILDFLDKVFPGGVDNISGLTVYVHRGSSIPVYISTKPAKDLIVPKVMSKKPKAFKTFKGELTTLPNADVIVKPSGRVIVKRIKDSEGGIEEEHAKKKKVQNKRARDHEVEDEGESVNKVKKNKGEINSNGVKQSPVHKKKKKASNKNETTNVKKHEEIGADHVKQHATHKKKMLHKEENIDKIKEEVLTKKKAAIKNKPNEVKKNVRNMDSIKEGTIHKKKTQVGQENINDVKKKKLVAKKKSVIKDKLSDNRKSKKETNAVVDKENINIKRKKNKKR